MKLVKNDSKPLRWQHPILRVVAYVVRYPAYAAGTLVCAIVTTLAGFIFPKVTGLIFDRVLIPHRPGLLIPYVLMIAGAFFARDLFNALRIVLNNTFEQKVIYDLRCELYAALQRLPVGWFDQRATGDLMTRVGEDVTNLERVLIDGVEQGVVALLQILGVGGVLFWINPRLTLWALIPVPFLVAGACIFTFTSFERHRVVRRVMSVMQSLLLDNLQGIRQIKSFAREKREEQHFARTAHDVQVSSMRIMRAWATYSPSMSFFAAVGSVIVLYVGGRDALASANFSSGQLIAFLLYVGMFYDPIGRLHQLNQMLQGARAAGERVFEILDAPGECYQPQTNPMIIQAAPPDATSDLFLVHGNVMFRNIHFQYRENLPVLHQINIEAAAGQTIALVGPTGAGKSTLVNLIPRFYEPTSGQILIDGRDTRDIPLTVLREQIGIVSQESFLFNATVLENLQFGRPNATPEEIKAASKAAHAHEFIMALPEGYQTNVGERGIKLSVGEKQRLSIARALLKDPPILIFDEATASVDTATERLIQEALERLLQGRTAFVIAHRLSTVRRADKILVINRGCIDEQGTHEQLIAGQGLYARLCRAQHLPFEPDF